MSATDKKTVREIDVAGQRVLVRVDFNVPMDRDNGAITDDSRIQASLPTVRYLLEHGARVALCSHLGRPKGKPDPRLSLGRVAQRLEALLARPVKLVREYVGVPADTVWAAAGTGDLLLLENLRYHPEEERNDPGFAKALAGLADVYVNDAFGAAHRAHASTEGVAHLLPAVAGFLMEKELRFLAAAMANPERPLAAVVGGAKVSDKIAMIEHMVDRVDALLIGGGMSATFFKGKGFEVGASLMEEELVAASRRIVDRARARGIALLLPIDVVVAQRFHADASARTVAASAVPPGWMIVDIGPQTQALFYSELKRCKTVVWNGPMGVFEMPRFSAGTRGMAELLAGLNATTIVGGGSTAQAVHELGLADKLSHVSTGGGASLELLEGKPLPGVVALMDR
ncbi:MAG: phosphoglycerate kinase [Dehalococcoidia bacterium]